jgi:hypothetical protein
VISQQKRYSLILESGLIKRWLERKKSDNLERYFRDKWKRQ